MPMLLIGFPAIRPTDAHMWARQVHVKAKYQLWVTADEKRVMENVLNSCKDTNPVKK